MLVRVAVTLDKHECLGSRLGKDSFAGMGYVDAGFSFSSSLLYPLGTQHRIF